MYRTSAFCVTGLLWIAVGSWSAGIAVADGQAPSKANADRFKNLPKEWQIVESIIVTADRQLAMFSQKLGGQLVRLSNTTFAVDGEQIKINVLECKTDEDATKVHQSLLRAHHNIQVACPKDGKTIIEFVGKDMRLVERAYQELAIKAPKVVYSVSFQAAPMEEGDYMQWNKLFNAFLVAEPNEATIRDLSQSFTFGDQIRVRTRGLGKEASTFTFTPPAQGSKTAADGDVTIYSFAGLPRKYGLPAVNATITVTSEAFAITPSHRRPGPELLGPNEFWPSKDPEIVALAQQITNGKTNTADKATAILEWLKPGKNVRYAGDITGSRYGTQKVLQQRFGHCWDFSDCFVTLCRASGVPSRQVLGWLYGESGHVWAEVLIDGKGWRQVDPTAGMGCDSRYVPFFANEDGKMPVVYTSSIRITPKEELPPGGP